MSTISTQGTVRRPVDLSELRASIESARRRHQSGAGTVLDVLLRTGEPAPAFWDQVLAQHAGVVPLWDLKGYVPDFSSLRVERAKELQVVPLRTVEGALLCLGMADPWSDDAARKACALLGEMPRILALTSASLTQCLAVAPPAIAEARTADSAAPGRSHSESSPVVDFVDSAIRGAFAVGASDIHFECNRASLVVRFRQDGVMTPFASLDDPRRAEEVISRIKVLAHLDITERRTPQDGRFRFDVGRASIDLRVSIMPSVFGEDAVLRLLDKAQLRSEQEAMSLDLLGLDASSSERIRELAELPHGMLLVTGPTGSGKTTTVYAALSEVNSGLEKIVTIEDPVEYELPGVLQIPVNERKGLTFAKGLRSILRHDPDRILVGEIRDAETADIAVQSALTGHQVFTTVHANSIFDVTGRFRHFGLDMFGFMSSLNGVIVQRLVRRLCAQCSVRRAADARETRWMAAIDLEVPSGGLPRPVGCKHCNGTGYAGRFVIAEVHVVTDALRDLVTGNAPVSALRELIATYGVKTLAQQGADFVLAGKTSAEEIKRVVGW